MGIEGPDGASADAMLDQKTEPGQHTGRSAVSCLVPIFLALAVVGHAQDRPEQLGFRGQARAWVPIEVNASRLKLLPGWNFYPARIAKDSLPPHVVAARDVDRAVGRAVVVTYDNLRLFLADKASDAGSARVPDAEAALEIVRVLADGRVIEGGAELERFVEAARILNAEQRHIEGSDLAEGQERFAMPEHEARPHERLLHWTVRLVDVSKAVARPKVEAVGQRFRVTLSVFRSERLLELVTVEADIGRNGALTWREHGVVHGPPCVWSTAVSGDGDARDFEREAREMRADVELARRRFTAALDARRSTSFARKLCTAEPPLSTSALVAALGKPDMILEGEEGVRVYILGTGKVLEFVGHPRVRELRLAEPPRPRTKLNDELVSGPAIERLWERGR